MITVKIVTGLLDDLLGQGYKSFMDNYYNSVHLCKTLFSQQVYVCGTLRINRGGPKDLQRLTKGNMDDDAIAFRHKDNVMVLLWKDKGVVSMITTFHNCDTNPDTRRDRFKGRDSKFHYQEKVINKPVLINECNQYTSGVDHLD